MKDIIYKTYKDVYPGIPALFSAPGRINIIGEHTDYNNGYVLPAAINKRIYFAIAKNNKKHCNIYAYNLKENAECQLSFVNQSGMSWFNYFRGVCNEIRKIKSFELSGFNMVFGGDLPVGAGMSSSAALETGFATALNNIYNIRLSQDEIIQLSQKAEHNYVGLQCGIMDQYTAVKGRKKNVILLDCRTLKHELYPLNLSDHCLVLCNSMVKHALASSEYNTRRKECEKGVQIMKSVYPEVEKLRDITVPMLEQNKHLFSINVYNRCIYIVLENLRVKDSCKKLLYNDLIGLGKNLYSGHEGLKNQYEVSCKEIDYLVDLTKENDAVLGSRMMGGGFGGCTINIVRKDRVKEFIKIMSEAYFKKFNIEPEFYTVETDDGIKSH